MISVDFSILIQVINFLFLIWILNIVLYKPIRKIILERKEKIDNLKNSVLSSVEQTKEHKKSVEVGIKEARAEGLKAKEIFINEATAEEKAIISRISDRAREDLEKIKEKIAKETSTVRETLKKEIDVFAKQIGEKVLGRSI